MKLFQLSVDSVPSATASRSGSPWLSFTRGVLAVMALVSITQAASALGDEGQGADPGPLPAAAPAQLGSSPSAVARPISLEGILKPGERRSFQLRSSVPGMLKIIVRQVDGDLYLSMLNSSRNTMLSKKVTQVGSDDSMLSHFHQEPEVVYVQVAAGSDAQRSSSFRLEVILPEQGSPANAIGRDRLELARSLFKQGELSAGLEALEQAQRAFQEAGNPEEQAGALLEGLPYMDVGDARRASALDTTIALFVRAGAIPAAAKCLSARVIADPASQEPAALARTADQLKDMLRLDLDENTRETLLRHVGLLTLQLEQLELAGRMFEQALPLAELLGDRYAQATILLSQGRIALKRGDARSAEAPLKKALELCRSLEGRVSQVPVLEALAAAARAQGEQQKAERLAKRASMLRSGSSTMLGKGGPEETQRANLLDPLGELEPPCQVGYPSRAQCDISIVLNNSPELARAFVRDMRGDLRDSLEVTNAVVHLYVRSDGRPMGARFVAGPLPARDVCIKTALRARFEPTSRPFAALIPFRISPRKGPRAS